MTRFGLGWMGAVALASAAFAGNSRAQKANPAPAASPAPGTAANASRTVDGRVELVDRANHVTLAGTEGVGLAFDKFTVDDRTQVTVNGQRARAADVNEGDAVRASFSGPDDAPHLDRLDVRTSTK